MDKFDRIQLLHRIFTSRRLPVSLRTLAEELKCTERNSGIIYLFNTRPSPHIRR